MFKLSNAAADAASSAAMQACMVDVRNSDQQRLCAGDEAFNMMQRLSSYKKYEDALRVVSQSRHEGMDKLKRWFEQDLVKSMGADFIFPEHVAVFVKYHYDKAEETVDTFVRKQLEVLEAEWDADFEPVPFVAEFYVPDVAFVGCWKFKKDLDSCIDTAQTTLDWSVLGAIANFTDSHAEFSLKFGQSLSSYIEQRVLDEAPVPSLLLLVDASRASFEEEWSKKAIKAYETTVAYEASTNTMFTRLFELNKIAAMFTYRRGVLIVLARFKDAQFLKFRAFVETLRTKHGMFADGTGTHIQAFIQNVLADATRRFDEISNDVLTIDKWTEETKKHHEALVPGADASMAWLEPGYISGSRSLHDVLKGIVAGGRAYFEPALVAASADFGLPDGEFRDKYLPDAPGAKRPVEQRPVLERQVRGKRSV